MSLNYELNLNTKSTPEEILKAINEEFNLFEYTKNLDVYHLHNPLMTISCAFLDEEDIDIGFKRFGFNPDIELCINVTTSNQNYLDTLIMVGRIVVKIIESEQGDATFTFNYSDIAIFKRISGKLYVNNKLHQANPLIIEIMKLDGELINIEIPDLEDD